MSSEEVETPSVEEIVDTKLSEAVEQLPLEKIAEGLEALLAENESLKSEIATIKEDFNAFKELPSATEEKEQKFARTEALTAADVREARLRKRLKK